MGRSKGFIRFAKLLLVHYHSTLYWFLRRLLELIMVFMDERSAIAGNKGIIRDIISGHVNALYGPSELILAIQASSEVYIATWASSYASRLPEDLALTQEASDAPTKQSWRLCFLTSLELDVGLN